MKFAAGRDCASAVHAAIIYVAGADMDATSSAYVAAETETNNVSNYENCVLIKSNHFIGIGIWMGGIPGYRAI